MRENKTIPVWDPFVRLFHWSLAVCVATACMTQHGGMRLHVVSGSVVIGLVLFRLIWGVVGPRHALFRDFVSNPMRVWSYLRSVVAGDPVRHLGHNPAGGVMVLLLLLTTGGTAGLGLVVYGVGEFGGPFSEWGLAWTTTAVYGLKKSHEVLANGVLLLVALHLMGVVLTSWQHRENLVKSMFTGRKTV